MDFRFTPEEEQFRQEIREFLQREWPQTNDAPFVTSAGGEADSVAREKEFRKKLAQKGWLSLSWPKEYGGQERSPMELFIFSWELTRHGAPYPFYATGVIGPTLMHFGSDWQKKTFLPQIAAGEIDFCLGFTEPGAGSDLASLQTRAEDHGDYYLINGQKIYTSMAFKAEYCWLAARTDPSAPKHRGISLFLVDMKSPGITITPLQTLRDFEATDYTHTTQTFWDNVRVPKEYLIGEPNRGWYYIMTTMDYDRIYGVRWGHLPRFMDYLIRLAKSTRRNGHSAMDDAAIRAALAELAIEVKIIELFSYRTAWMIAKGQVPNYEASMMKVYGVELYKRMADMGMRILGSYGQIAPGDRLAPASGRINRAYIETGHGAGGGSSEIQRNIIAQRGLGLPR